MFFALCLAQSECQLRLILPLSPGRAHHETLAKTFLLALAGTLAVLPASTSPRSAPATTVGAFGTRQWPFPQSAGVFRLTNRNVLNAVWNAQANTSTWEIYRPTGELLVRRRIARAYRPWTLARNGDVLATVVDTTTGEVVVVRLALRVT